MSGDFIFGTTREFSESEIKYRACQPTSSDGIVTKHNPTITMADSTLTLPGNPASDLFKSSEHSAFVRVSPLRPPSAATSAVSDKGEGCRRRPTREEREPGELPPPLTLPVFKGFPPPPPPSPLFHQMTTSLMRPFNLLSPSPYLMSPFSGLTLPQTPSLDYDPSIFDAFPNLRRPTGGLWSNQHNPMFSAHLHGIDMYYQHLRELHSVQQQNSSRIIQTVKSPNSTAGEATTTNADDVNKVQSEEVEDDEETTSKRTKKMSTVVSSADSTDEIAVKKIKIKKEEEEEDLTKEEEDEEEEEEEEEEEQSLVKIPPFSRFSLPSPGLPSTFAPPPLPGMYPGSMMLRGSLPPMPPPPPQPSLSAALLHPMHAGLQGRRPRDPTKPPPVKKYTCDLCGKAFSRSNTLVTHRRIHTGEKPFKCEVCGRAFRQPGNLTRHRLTHTTVKPYVCPICKKAFNRASNLHTHMRTHTNFKPFVCPYCGKGFHEKVDMKIHSYTHTGRPLV